MPKTPLAVQEFGRARTAQDISGFDLSTDELLGLLSQFDLYGIWLLDLESGQLAWSRDIFEIHGMAYTSGHVDQQAVLRCYHPDDAKIVGQLIDETIANKSGFRFQLRLRNRDGKYRLVKSVGRYRVAPNGREQVIGTFTEYPPQVRSVASTSFSENPFGIEPDVLARAG
ncbi:MAG: PAS domain-containing protein [Nitratireductor sp.]|nr:PAS domain-containing protein [Nitratireductor sp.]